MIAAVHIGDVASDVFGEIAREPCCVCADIFDGHELASGRSRAGLVNQAVEMSNACRRPCFERAGRKRIYTNVLWSSYGRKLVTA